MIFFFIIIRIVNAFHFVKSSNYWLRVANLYNIMFVDIFFNLYPIQAIQVSFIVKFKTAYFSVIIQKYETRFAAALPVLRSPLQQTDFRWNNSKNIESQHHRVLVTIKIIILCLVTSYVLNFFSLDSISFQKYLITIYYMHSSVVLLHVRPYCILYCRYAYIYIWTLLR